MFFGDHRFRLGLEFTKHLIQFTFTDVIIETALNSSYDRAKDEEDSSTAKNDERFEMFCFQSIRSNY